MSVAAWRSNQLAHGPAVDDRVVARLLEQQRQAQARLPQQPPVPDRLLEEEARRHLAQAERVVADEVEVRRVAGEELGLERDADRPVLVDDAADHDLELVLRGEVDLGLERRADEREPGELVLRARARSATPGRAPQQPPTTNAGAPSSSRFASSTKRRDVVDELPVGSKSPRGPLLMPEPRRSGR